MELIRYLNDTLTKHGENTEGAMTELLAESVKRAKVREACVRVRVCGRLSEKVRERVRKCARLRPIARRATTKVITERVEQIL